MSFSQRTVTAVIPAYNEEKYIGNILAVLGQVPQLSQIIIVDDGSVDATALISRSYVKRDGRAQLIQLAKNQGKGGAMLAGARASINDLILFLDADLIGLRPENVMALMEPVQQEQCSMAIATFTQGRRQTDWSHKLTPFLSGQRCLAWPLFRATPYLDVSRWGVELALSLYAWHNRYCVTRVAWPGVTHAMRMEKLTGLKGYWSHLQMWLDIGWYLVKYSLNERRQLTRPRSRFSRAFSQGGQTLFHPHPIQRMTRVYHGDLDEN